LYLSSLSSYYRPCFHANGGLDGSSNNWEFVERTFNDRKSFLTPPYLLSKQRGFIVLVLRKCKLWNTLINYIWFNTLKFKSKDAFSRIVNKHSRNKIASMYRLCYEISKWPVYVVMRDTVKKNNLFLQIYKALELAWLRNIVTPQLVGKNPINNWAII